MKKTACAFILALIFCVFNSAGAQQQADRLAEISQFPACYFNSDVPERAGLFLTGKAFGAVTMADGLAGFHIPAGIYFEKSKGDVSESSAAHELEHWTMYRDFPRWYTINLAIQYKIWGHDSAPVEKRCEKAGARGLDTDEKQAWWDAL